MSKAGCSWSRNLPLSPARAEQPDRRARALVTAWRPPYLYFGSRVGRIPCACEGRMIRLEWYYCTRARALYRLGLIAVLAVLMACSQNPRPSAEPAPRSAGEAQTTSG